MKPGIAKSMELYEMMLKCGYPEVFCIQHGRKVWQQG